MHEMLCTYCKATTPSAGRFCMSCGKPLQQVGQHSTAVAPPPRIAAIRIAPAVTRVHKNPIIAAAVIGLFVLLGAGALAVLIPSDPPSTAKAVAVSPVDQNDAQALYNAHEIKADTACAVYADGYLRRAAKYDFKWDEIGFGESKFGGALPRVDAPGVIVLVSDKVKLQNGFGAFKRVRMFCHYNTNTDGVPTYTIDAED